MEVIQSQLKAYHSADPLQLMLKKQILEFLELHGEGAFFRETLSGHITGSAWVLDAESRSETLLVHHRKLGRWLQPGGHSDGDTQTERVAARELSEETGVVVVPQPGIFDLDTHAIPWHKDVPPHLHFDIRYLFLVPRASSVQCSEESHEVQWFKLSQLSEVLTDESVCRMAAKSNRL